MEGVDVDRESTKKTLVRMEEIPGRGRAVVSSQPLRGGQIVLRDSPILLYSALPLTVQQQKQQQSTSSSLYCDNCFRTIQPQSSSKTPCPNCFQHHFCSSNCLSAALTSSHSPWICHALSRLRDSSSHILHQQPLERHVQARFLVAAYNLALFSPPHWQSLLSLQGHAQEEDAPFAHFLHSLVSALCPPPPLQVCSFSLELTSLLLAKDKINAFGLMENLYNGDRSVRAYGIYPKAALFNHDCLPNACRFDYIDSADTTCNNNTDIVVRMIHDVPEGREICLSYFPVNWDFATRQKRLAEDYGFTCHCDRCQVEATWSDADDNHDDNDDDDNDDDDNLDIGDEDENEMMMDQECVEPMTETTLDNNDSNNFPHSYFFLRYMCNRENCWGTLAPLPPLDCNPSNFLECNVCGNIKKDEFVDG